MTSNWGMQTWRSMNRTSKWFGDTCSLFWRLQVTRPKIKLGAEPEDVVCQRRSRKKHFNFMVTDHYKIMPNILLMEEIANNHLECIKPCKQWINYLEWTGDRRISSLPPFTLETSTDLRWIWNRPSIPRSLLQWNQWVMKHPKWCLVISCCKSLGAVHGGKTD